MGCGGMYCTGQGHLPVLSQEFHPAVHEDNPRALAGLYGTESL